jgi:uncharacterized protein (TIGR00369 family)
MKPLPPYARILGLRASDRDGSPMFVMPFHEGVVGRPGYLHGGAIAGLLEFAAFEALSAAIDDPAVVMKPVTVTVDYLRGGSEKRGDTFAEALIERLGNRIANVEAVAWQTDRSKPIAAAQINFLLERPE